MNAYYLALIKKNFLELRDSYQHKLDTGLYPDDEAKRFLESEIKDLNGLIDKVVMLERR